MKENKKDQLKILKDFGIDEICNKTHIEAETIENVINKNFEKLKDKNTLCYVKILEREFNVDLKDFLNEFYDFKNRHKSDQQFQVNKPLTCQNLTSGTKNSNIVLFVLFFAFFVAIIYFIFDKNPNLITNFLNDKNRTISYSDAKIVEKIENKLTNIGVNMPIFDENKTLISDENLSQKTDEPNVLQKIVIAENLVDENRTKSENLPKSASILVPGAIWVGLINLEDGTKFQTNANKIYDLDLTKNQILLTGHGIFTLKIGDEIKNFNDKNGLKFHIENGKIFEISNDEFLKLNKGKSW